MNESGSCNWPIQINALNNVGNLSLLENLKSAASRLSYYTFSNQEFLVEISNYFGNNPKVLISSGTGSAEDVNKKYTGFIWNNIFNLMLAYGVPVNVINSLDLTEERIVMELSEWHHELIKYGRIVNIQLKYLDNDLNTCGVCDTIVEHQPYHLNHIDLNLGD